jgi:hypothetical protein
MLQCKYTILILSENIEKRCEGLTNNIWLVFFFWNLPEVCLAKLIFIQKQCSQNKSKGVFAKQPLNPKTSSKKY